MSSAKKSDSSTSKSNGSALKVQGGKVDKTTKNWNDLIPGYDKLSPLDKMKARSQHQLKRVASRDDALKAGSKQWERFTFNQNAPLNKRDKPELNDIEDDEDRQDRAARSAAPPKTAADNKHDDAIFGNAGVEIDDKVLPNKASEGNANGLHSEDEE